jgi:hypothetical protein
MLEDTNTEVTDAGASEEAVTSAAAPVSLTLNDLANLKQIIDVVARRGAFRAEEMAVVGNTYTRLTSFLQSIAPQPQATEAEETTEETTEA